MHFNYPCLDVVQIHEVVVNFHCAVASRSRSDFDIYNRITDPMDLYSIQSTPPVEGYQEAMNLAAVDQEDQEGGNGDEAQYEPMDI